MLGVAQAFYRAAPARARSPPNRIREKSSAVSPRAQSRCSSHPTWATLVGWPPGQVHRSVDQHVLVHGPDGADLGGLVVDDDERAVLRSQEMIGPRVAGGSRGKDTTDDGGIARRYVVFGVDTAAHSVEGGWP